MSAATPLGYEHHTLSTTLARRWFAVFVRMLWKEFRVVLPFLLVVAATMAGLATLLAWVMRDQLHDAWGALYAIVVLFPLLFALGCGGMSYASEREDGTWDWLRRIAAPPSAVCAAKIVVGLICGLLLATVAWLALAWFAWRPELAQSAVDVSHRRLVVLLIGVATTLLVSQIVSSLIKNVFVVLIVSGVALAPVLTIGLALGTDHSGQFFGMGFTDTNFALMWIGSLAPLLGLIVCELSLADCWMKDVAPWRAGLIGLLVNPTDRQRLILSAGQNPLAHLMSREWALARPWLWALGLTPVIPILLATQSQFSRLQVEQSQFSRLQVEQYGLNGSRLLPSLGVPLVVIANLLLALVPALLGVWAYQPDQHELRFRFLADRGISPTLIWLSKHAVRVPMLFLLLLAAVVVGLLGYIALEARDAVSPAVGWALGTMVGVTVVSYSVGQLIGQLIRSPITSSFLAAVLSLQLVSWMQCLRLLNLPFVFDLVPIAILFAASWLRSPDWLLERTSWRARLQLAASLIVPFALLYGTVGWYRMSGLPRVARKSPTVAEMQPWQARKSEAESELERSLKQLDETYRDEFAAMKAELKSLQESLLPPNNGPFELGAGGFGGSAPEPALGFMSGQTPAQYQEHVQRTQEVVQKLFPALATEALPSETPKFVHELQLQLRDLNEAQGDRQWHSRMIAKLSDDAAVRPYSLATLHLHEVYRRLFDKTRQQAQALSLVIRKPDRFSWRFDHQCQIPIELLELQAHHLLEQGAPDESLSLLCAAECVKGHGWQVRNAAFVQRFLTTAAQCQKSDRLRQYIRESNEIPETLEVLKKELQWAWAHINDTSDDARLLAGHGHATLHDHASPIWLFPTSPASPFLMRLFPWELSVVRHEASVYLARDLAVAEALDDVIHDRAANRIGWQNISWPLTPNAAGRFLPLNSEFERPVRPTGLLSAIPDEAAQQQLASPKLRSDPLSRELERRQFVLLLALIAWHHDHGELPESLDQLVGPYFDKLPLDPLTAKPFVFQKLPTPRVMPPCVQEKRVPQLRVRSLDDTHDVWLELRIEYMPHRLPDKLFTKAEAEQ